MTTITQVITALPTAPDPATMTRDEFSTAAAAFVLAQKDDLVPELNTWAGQVNTVKGEMVTHEANTAASAATATTQAGIATTQAGLAAASAATAIAAPGTSATSVTSDTIALGSTTITIQTGKALVVGMFVVQASTASPSNYNYGQITAYDSGTGSLTIDVTSKNGSGTFSAWTVSLTAAATNIGTIYTAPGYTRDDDGTVSGGTWSIDYANGPVIKATAGAAITSITMSNWPASGTAGHLRLMLSAGAYSITFPAWKWIKSDLTTTTTFADLGLTLPSANPAIIDLFSDDGGTTMYATIGRN